MIETGLELVNDAFLSIDLVVALFNLSSWTVLQNLGDTSSDVKFFNVISQILRFLTLFVFLVLDTSWPFSFIWIELVLFFLDLVGKYVSIYLPF